MPGNNKPPVTKKVDWPQGQWVCVQCGTEMKAQHFGRDTNVCYNCVAMADRDKLAKAMAERKAQRAKLHKMDRIEQRRAAGRLGGITRGKQKKEEAKERRRIKRAAQRKVEQHADLTSRQMAPQVMAEKELASRELARRSLLHYTERNVPGYEAGWVHEDICRRLEKFMEDVEDRKSPRLMLWMPPRHGKSELASTQYPSWVLGHHPEWEFISASYTVDLPLGFSKKVRAQISSDSYKNIFPKTVLSKDWTGAEQWKTSEGGGYRAAGVGGGVTGMGAHIFVIDDPVKGHVEADSETTRERNKGWYSSDVYTRQAPGAGVLVIQTRWHDDDLSGWLQRLMAEGYKEYEALRDEAAVQLAAAKTQEEVDDAKQSQREAGQVRESIDKWEIVVYPAIATSDEYLNTRSGTITTGENVTDLKQNSSHYRLLRKKGEALHPARFPLPLLRKYKRNMQPRDWAALMQQNPTPDEGAFFTTDMLRFRATLPDWRHMTTFVTWDLAIGLKTTNDWTVGLVAGLDWEDNLWILDMLRGRWATQQIAENILDTHVRYNATMTGIEKGQLELAIMPILRKRMAERSKYITLAEGNDALVPISDKIVRARPLQGRLQQGKVLLPMDQPWVETLTNELLRFPTGVHDDIVDAAAWMARMTMHVQPPPSPDTVRRNPTFVSWRDRLDGIIGRGGTPKNFMAR